MSFVLVAHGTRVPRGVSLIGDLADLAETRGKTLIAVSHDATLHERMDRVIDIVDGCWTGEG